MSLEGAYLITNRKLDQGKPDVMLHTEVPDDPYACVGLGASGNYVRIHSAEVARGFAAAFARAAEMLDTEAVSPPRPPYGTPERAAWDESHAGAGQGWRDEATGLISGGLVTDDAPLTGCVRCAATDVPLRALEHEPGMVCNNSVTCAERRAGRAQHLDQQAGAGLHHETSAGGGVRF